jgi:hypothetical protein
MIQTVFIFSGQIQVVSCCGQGNELSGPVEGDLLEDSKGFSSSELTVHSDCYQQHNFRHFVQELLLAENRSATVGLQVEFRHKRATVVMIIFMIIYHYCSVIKEL